MRRALFKSPIALIASSQLRAMASAAPAENEVVKMTKEQLGLSADARQFYNNSGPGGGEDRNWMLSQSTANPGSVPLTNHHFGIGEADPNLNWDSDEAILNEVHRLECNQIDHLLGALGPLGEGSHLLDCGSGRGGTAFRAFQLSGGKAQIDGVTLAEDQAAYANNMAEEHGIAGNARFHVKNMLQLCPAVFPEEHFTHAYQNETDMYVVDAEAMYQHFHRLLKPGGKIAISSWCNAARSGKVNQYSAAIDKNYGTKMHTDLELEGALVRAKFKDIKVVDFTELAQPYWHVRSRWSQASGVEKPFVDGHACGDVRYLIFSGTKA